MIKIAFHVRLPEDLDKRLKEYAEQNGMSENQTVKKALRALLNGNKKAPKGEQAEIEIIEVMELIKTDPVKFKSFIVNVLGQEWETRSFNE